MQPSYITFGEAPMPFMPFPMAAPPGISFTDGAMNIRDRQPAGTPEFYNNFAMLGPGQGFAAGAAVVYHQELQPAGAAVAYHNDFHAYNFGVAGTGAGYQLEPRAAGVWPLDTPNNPVGTGAYQLHNGTVLWPDNGVDQHPLGEQEQRSRLFDRWM
jgi:hypothetical protein